MFENTFRSIQLCDWEGDGINRIICGGYNKTLHIIQDFHWGKKEIMDIIPLPQLQGATIWQVPGFVDTLFFPETINRIENLLANSPEELIQIQSLSGNNSVSIFRESTATRKIETMYDLLDYIITPDQVVLRQNALKLPQIPSLLIPSLVQMPSNGKDFIIGQFPGGRVPAKPKPHGEGTYSATGGAAHATIADVVDEGEKSVNHLREVGTIPTKAKLIAAAVSLGIPADFVQGVLASLTQEQRIAYFRKAPRGYRATESPPEGSAPAMQSPARMELISDTGSAAHATMADTVAGGELLVNHLREVGTIPTKAKLIAAAVSLGIPADFVQGVLASLTQEQRIAYFRKAPRGYRATESPPEGSAPAKPSPARMELISDTGAAAHATMVDTEAGGELLVNHLREVGTIPTKAKLIAAAVSLGIPADFVQGVLAS